MNFVGCVRPEFDPLPLSGSTLKKCKQSLLLTSVFFCHQHLGVRTSLGVVKAFPHYVLPLVFQFSIGGDS